MRRFAGGTRIEFADGGFSLGFSRYIHGCRYAIGESLFNLIYRLRIVMELQQHVKTLNSYCQATLAISYIISFCFIKLSKQVISQSITSR